jgi:putative transposase
VVRLTDKRIAYACRQADKGRGGEPAKAMAARWGVTDRRVRQVQQQYRETGEVPTLNPNRRPKGPPLTDQEKSLLGEIREYTHRGASKMYKALRKRGVKIPKHKIHAYATQQGWSKPNPRKQKKRKRCRYEREHTASLLHGDWHRTSETHPYVIVWLDDASRYAAAGGEFDAISAEQSMATFQRALDAASAWNVHVREANTDRGSEFYCNEQWDKEQGVSQFQGFLQERGVRHVVSGRNNPQTNGKLERFWLEYDRHRWRFASLEAFLVWSNDQIHDELWQEVYETPVEAWQRKLPPEAVLGLHLHLVETMQEVPAL